MEEYDQENHSFSDEKFMSRKSKKPLMEKRRRARINNCLSQLKSLVLQAMKKDTTHYSKLEKADILEMTVKYLRNLQRRQISSAVAADPTVAAKFSVGFNECATEVARYLNNAHGINEDVRGRLLGHLSNCVQSSNAQSVQMGQAFLQPLHVQIPASQSRLGMGHGQTENLLIAQHSGFTSQIASTGMQVHTSFTVSPDSVFEGNRINSTPSRLNDSSEQKQYQRIHVQCVSSTSNSGNSETQSVLCNRQQTKPCHVYTEPSSPERVGFRPPVTSTPEYKVPGFSTSPLFASASSALKEEKLWRPW